MTVERSLVHLRGPLGGLSRQRLWLQVLVAMVLGVGFGVLIGPTGGLLGSREAVLVGNWIGLPGRLFLLAIQFVVVPLVVASVVRGIAAGEGADSLGRLGGLTVGFFIVTTLIAVIIGMGLAIAIDPGRLIDGATLADALTETDQEAAAAAAAAGQAIGPPSVEALPELIVSLFPRDPLTTFISGNMLQIVLTSVIIGIALVNTPVEQRRPLLELLASVQAACMAIVGWVLRFAPYAVFGLLANITARVGLSALIGVSAYVATVLLGLLALLAFYLAIVALVGRRSPIAFMRDSREALLLAFSTSSSAAVMPVSLGTAETKLGVRSSTARFVIPLGTTINMGGTALYQGVATLFLAQAFAVDIGLPGMVLVVVMAVGAAIGSPGTPGVGIVILATILNSVGVPAAGIAMILGVDRLLDMCRTVVNVAGDLAASVVVDHWLKGPEEREAEHLGRVPTPAMTGQDGGTESA
ncbi:MAG: dicarboxylate/amino acid:cation symporter [Inquilinus sp.]|nr:dicarboxylate/amino acid:cation symporter [Inquilinus sp.]